MQRKGKLTQTRSLVGVERIALSGNIAKGKDKNTGRSAPTRPAMFMKNFSPVLS